MHPPGRSSRLILASALTALAITLTLAGTAAASRGFAITNGTTLVGALGGVTVRSSPGAGQTCTWYLVIELESSITKRAGTAVGRILPSPASRTIGDCPTIFLDGATLAFTSFSGTLPDISMLSANAAGLAFERDLGSSGRCLYGGGTVNTALLRLPSTRQIGGLAVSGTGLSAGTGCPGPLSFYGTLTIIGPLPILDLV